MLKHQLAIGVEDTWGTPVAPDRGYEFLPGETLGRDNIVLNSSGIRPGQLGQRGSSRVLTGRGGSGSISLEVATKGFGRIFEHMLGGDPDITQLEGTAAYLHTYGPGILEGKGLTIQKGVEPFGGNAVPFTFAGCKIPSWQMQIARNGILQVTLDVDSKDVLTEPALYAGEFAPAKLFHFMQAVLRLDGEPVANVSEWQGRGTNPLDTDRYFLGGGGTKAEQTDNNFRALAGDMTADFISLETFYAAFEEDASLEVELSFVGDPIAEGASDVYREELTVLVDDVRLTGETPKVASPAPAVQNIPWEGFETDSGDLIAITYQTTDSEA